MASLATSLSFSLQHRLVSGVTHTNPPSTSTSTAVHFSAFAKTKIKITKLTLTSSSSIFFNHSLLSFSSFPAPSPVSKPFSLFVVSAKGYKMKTHKASAKRFRVTGTGKIMRRRAGKQHLLRKKNTKRRVRLSKMLQVNRSDYNNVIGALPYLKVNRQN